MRSASAQLGGARATAGPSTASGTTPAAGDGEIERDAPPRTSSARAADSAAGSDGSLNAAVAARLLPALYAQRRRRDEAERAARAEDDVHQIGPVALRGASRVDTSVPSGRSACDAGARV